MISELLKLFKATAARFGFPEWLVNEIVFYLVLVGFVFFVLQQLYKLLIRFFLWNNQRRLNRDLHPYYSKSDVERTTKYFIPVKHQSVAPSIDVELGSNYFSVPKEESIPIFLKRAFKNDKDDNKYYLLLADSGMGKTTFMINLYIRYKNAFRFPFAPPKYDIKLFPMGYPNILEDIEKIKDKENTILLLDAFDEDFEAIKDHEKRLNEILSKVYKFREIVITCRTQFFPSEKEEPDRTGYFTGGERGQYKFEKNYLSVFDEKDIKRYLRKRFSFFQFKKRKIAKQIADKSPTLVVRPMLLSHIEDLVKSNKSYEFSFQIYEELIDRWIEREANKPKVSKLFGDEANAKKCLRSFSENLAIYLYENREKHGGYFLPKGEKFDEKLIDILNIRDVEVGFLENIAKGKSLLNRDAAGNYKFSHKSVLEYFLAKKFFDNPALYQNFNFQGMDATDNFFKEMLVDKLRNKEGEFIITSAFYTFEKDGTTHKKVKQSKKISLNKITVRDISNIGYLKVEEFKGINPLFFEKFTNLKELIFIDWQRLGFIYICDLVRDNTLINKEIIINKAFTILLMKSTQEKVESLSRLTKFSNLQQRLRLTGFSQRIDLMELLDDKNIQKFRTLEHELLIEKLIAANQIVKEIQQLKKELRNCTVWY